MHALDAYNNILGRVILDEAVAELNQLKINSEPNCFIHNDLLQVLQKLSDELYASNSISTLTRFNNDKHNQSILVQRHLSARISTDFYAKLLTDTNAIETALKKTTHENIIGDYVKINAVKLIVTQHWQETRQEQKKIQVDERTECLAMEIDRLNNLIDGVRLCREATKSFHNKKVLRLKHQIDHWKCLLRKDFEKLGTEIEEGKLMLEKAIKHSVDIADMIGKRQEIIDNFNAEQEEQEKQEKF